MVRLQLELSDDEDKIVQVFRMQHNVKTNEDAVRQIIKRYKPDSTENTNQDKSWIQKVTGLKKDD